MNTDTELIEQCKKAVTAGKRFIAEVIEAGRLLSLKKDELGHGQWIPYVEQTLPITRRTASTWMKLYRCRDLLEGKWEMISYLSDAIKVIEADKPQVDNTISNTVDIKLIDCNPYFDYPSALNTEEIEFYYNLFQEMQDYFPEPLTVSPSGDRYILLCNHNQLAAMQLLNYKQVKVFILYNPLTKTQLQWYTDKFDSKTNKGEEYG